MPIHPRLIDPNLTGTQQDLVEQLLHRHYFTTRAFLEQVQKATGIPYHERQVYVDAKIKHISFDTQYLDAGITTLYVFIHIRFGGIDATVDVEDLLLLIPKISR